MIITIDTGKHHNVNITGDVAGPAINIDLSPAAAYELLQDLEKHRTTLHDLATNYYECRECGENHKDGSICPSLKRKR
jgi:hypothetical protein